MESDRKTGSRQPAPSAADAPDGRPRRRRIPWAGLAVSAATLLVLAALLEVGFRVLESVERPVDPERIWAVYDEDLGYRNRPFFADHNALGHRDRPLDRPKSRFRLLLLGDSVAYYGDDPDDTWPGRLETQLDARGDTAPVEVVNSAVRGWTLFQERSYLEKTGADLEPDLVGVGFVLNDVHRVLHRFEVADGRIVDDEYEFADEAVGGVSSPVYRLARKSRLLVFLRSRLTILEHLVQLYTARGFSFDYRPDFNTAWQEGRWPFVEDQLAAMAQLGRERGFRLFVVVFPFAQQLRPDYLERDRAYVTLPQRKLAEACAGLGVPFLDLMDALDAERDLEEDGIHLTRSGRRVAAERVADFLVREGLVPADDAGLPSHPPS